jgi:hypothetical protein
MPSQCYVPYRGCHIEVHVTLAKPHAIGGACRRYWGVADCLFARSSGPESCKFSRAV